MIELWDLETKEKISSFEHSELGFSIACTFDGAIIAFCGLFDDVTLYEASSGREIGTIKRDFPHSLITAFNGLCFNHKGTRLLVANQEYICLWDAIKQRRLLNIPMKMDFLVGMLFSPNDTLIAVVQGHIISLWNAETGSFKTKLQGHIGLVSSVAFSEDGRRIVSVSRGDNTIRIWDTDTGVELLTLSDHDPIVLTAAFSEDGKTLYSCHEYSGFEAHDSKEPQIIKKWKTISE